jgi:hypothetical protein
VTLTVSMLTQLGRLLGKEKERAEDRFLLCESS